MVAKHRNGATRDITVAFQGHYSRFVDMAHWVAASCCRDAAKLEIAYVLLNNARYVNLIGATKARWMSRRNDWGGYEWWQNPREPGIQSWSDSLLEVICRSSRVVATQIPHRLAERLRVCNLPSG
jgi:hypothetical protein